MKPDDVVLPLADAAAWDLLPAMVLVLGPEGRARHVNAACAARTGLAPQQGEGSGWLDALDADARDALLAELPHGRDFALPLRLRRADGTLAWIDCEARRVGECHVCVLHDVTAGREAERAAWSKAQQLRLLADHMPVLIAYFQVEGWRCLFANRQYARTFGFDERSILDRPLDAIVGADAMAHVGPHLDRLLHERRAVSYERELTLADGASRWIEVDMVPHLDGDGVPTAMFVLVTDISRFRLAERAVRESEERTAKFVQASAEGILFHQGGIISDVNPALCALLGYTLDEMRGHSALAFVAPQETAKAAAIMAAGAETTYETALVHRDGTHIPVECIVRTTVHDGQRLRMGIVRDLRDRQAAQAHIRHLAHHDALTGLPNRMAFLERLTHTAAVAGARGGAGFTLLFIDLDHFKHVNDILGHGAGDEVLQAVAARLTRGLRASDAVARFGGDEFLVLLDGTVDRGEVEAVAQQLLKLLEISVDTDDGVPIVVSPSIGIARFPTDAAEPAELIRCADAAMYEAKRAGRAAWRFFDPAAAGALPPTPAAELARAIAEGELTLRFRPRVRVADGRLAAVETVVMWRHPERGLLPPAAFFPVAAQHRLALPLACWTLRIAARIVRSWKDGPLGDVALAVDLAGLPFDQGDFADALAALLREEDFPAGRLTFELADRLPTAEAMERLKSLGVRLLLAGVGATAAPGAWLPLAALRTLPVDALKLDRTLVADLPADARSAAVVRAVVALTEGLGLRLVAEGVDRVAQQRTLAALGCDDLQGDAVGQPMTAAALVAWVAARQPVRRLAVRRRASSPAASSRRATPASRARR